MRLIPEQIIELRKSLVTKMNNLEGYKSYFEANRNEAIDNDNFTRLGDVVTENNYIHDKSTFDKLREILATSTIVDEPCLDHIDVGTKFKILYDGDDEEIPITLVEYCDLLLDRDDRVVTVNSPLGEKLIGAKVGDVVTFKVKDRSFKVKVTDIITDKEEYIRPIRSKKYDSRVCNRFKKDVNEAISNNDAEAYMDLTGITSEQVALLYDEYNRIVRSGKKDGSTLSRKGVITKLLKDSKVIKPETNDTIEVGSIFSVKLKREDEEFTLENVQLVNRAVSDEYSFEFVERIGALGYSVYGLREHDSFKVRIGRNTYTGYVYNICNNNQLNLARGNQYRK